MHKTINTDTERKILFTVLTNKCDLSCPHCVSRSIDGDMSLGTFEKTIATNEQSIRTIALTGGEPSLSPVFREIVKLAQSSGYMLSINSNGLILKRGVWREILTTKTHFFISLDALYGDTSGPRKQLYDLLGTISKEGIPVNHITVVSTVSASTLPHLPRLAAVLADKGISQDIQPIYVHDRVLGERLENVDGRVWDEAIDCMSFIDLRKTRYLKMWKAIYHNKVRLPTPKSCQSIARFVVVGPSGRRFRCFPHLTSLTQTKDFPSCFGYHCLFCWDHDLLANMLEVE